MLEIESFSLIGISMGGFVAQEIMSLAPSGLKSVALLCTTGGGDFYQSFSPIKDEDLKKLFNIEKENRDLLSVINTTDPVLKNTKVDVFNEILEYRKNLNVNLEELIKQNRAATEFFETNLDLSNNNVPVFIGHGENDRIVPVDNSKKLANELKNSTHVIYPKTDHFFFWEESSHLNTDLETFFMENAL